MFMGLTDADFQVAEYRRHEMLREAQRQRSRADDRIVPGPAGPGTIRSLLGSRLAWVGRILAGRAPHPSAGGAVAPADRLANARWSPGAPPTDLVRRWAR